MEFKIAHTEIVKVNGISVLVVRKIYLFLLGVYGTWPLKGLGQTSSVILGNNT